MIDLIAERRPTTARPQVKGDCMERLVRRRMEMGGQARDFNRTRPSSDPNHGLVLAELEETIEQMEALAAQQVTGVVSRGSSAVRRRDIRQRAGATRWPPRMH